MMAKGRCRECGEGNIYCKFVCRKCYMQKYSNNHKTQRKIYNILNKTNIKDYDVKNKILKKEYMVIYNNKNNVHRKEYQKIYDDKNKEKNKSYQNEYKIKNPEKSQEYYKKNKTSWKNNYIRRKEAIIEYRKRNRKKTINQTKMWQRTPEGRASRINAAQKRKNKFKNIKHNFTHEQWQSKIRATKGFCPLCKIFIGFEYESPQSNFMTMDHEPAVDLVETGHIYNINDVTPLCRCCNSSKHTKNIKFDFNNMINELNKQIEEEVR